MPSVSGRHHVSIHAPARGATVGSVGSSKITWTVSIHAPARGATTNRHPRPHLAISCFNPRTREGCDSFDLCSMVSPGMFQSTHPRGVRRQSTRICHLTHRCFNPRTREGCDTSVPSSLPVYICFNPRTREGCDSASFCLSGDKCLFQSTHPRGVRRY